MFRKVRITIQLFGIATGFHEPEYVFFKEHYKVLIAKEIYEILSRIFEEILKAIMIIKEVFHLNLLLDIFFLYCVLGGCVFNF